MSLRLIRGPAAVCRRPLQCLSQQKDGEEEKGSTTVRVAYLSLVEEFLFYT